jgi:MFS transporter, DHA2 family, multidrug resistance protein
METTDYACEQTGGVMIPTAFTAAVVLFAGKQKAVAASCVSAAAGLAPTLGPVIGGWITDDWSWHWLFYINILPGTAVAVLAPGFVRMDEPDLTLLKGADYLGMILMAVCLGCLDYVLEEGARWEWFLTTPSQCVPGLPRSPAPASSSAA